jgi:hypothetical protein
LFAAEDCLARIIFVPDQACEILPRAGGLRTPRGLVGMRLNSRCCKRCKLVQHEHNGAQVTGEEVGTLRGRQAMLASTKSTVGAPLSSTAGVKRARERMSRQDAASSADEPLELVMTQFWTRPSGLTVSLNPTVPSSPARSALAG